MKIKNKQLYGFDKICKRPGQKREVQLASFDVDVACDYSWLEARRREGVYSSLRVGGRQITPGEQPSVGLLIDDAQPRVERCQARILCGIFATLKLDVCGWIIGVES